MKEIPLNKGRTALVSDEDFDRVNAFKWYAYRAKNTFYASCALHDDMHRFILGLTDSKIHVDHRDGNGLNNQRNNLRQATHAQNQQNQTKHDRSASSKFKGVCWEKRRSRWKVSIKTAGKLRHIGYFVDEEDAARCYDAAAISSFGEYACLNFPQERSN